MQALEQQQEQSDDRLEQKAKLSYPEEIIEEIFSRLPVKSILRFRSLSKPWLSIISGPRFTKLQITRATRTALFISARDRSNGDRHLFSGSLDGGSVTHLMTIGTSYCPEDTEAEHLNGLVCFNYGDLFHDNNITLVLNPSTHKFFKLPDRVSDNYIASNLFGFDESRNEHKVLNISQSFEDSDTIEIMIFSISNYSWRKIDVDLPVNVSLNVSRHRWYYSGGSVCVNSTVHLMLRDPLEILAFDLRTEKFCIVKIPSDAVPQDTLHPCTRLIKINGLLGILSHDRVEESNEMHIWILQDYEKRVWVEETIRFPGSWIKMGRPFPLDSGNTDEIMFSPSVLSEDLFEVPIYDMKRRCFKSIQLTLDRQFVWPEAVELEEIKCYVESLIPLQNQQNDTYLRF
ncbi:putative F-box domain-containing protein [Helianthus annuus]|uniref:F-box domain-containing protein n=1 Tax=Helianthus annuus TaxID=4232 RepID=A0A251UQI4_HELAN|nr:putative F-box protein At1g32420 [Helianthus annuus]XP_022038308.1 putative F-box protein At1g32420 [Helianthus annuus]KAF5805821.1 putative F-box domain-containing protein [Helianthus annuus]KAJ0570179.1 putative F-box domain-containing protein [Helianthus annuus]KAJ0584525.1 putative F-box domain-containing protein [Helianthus annuus]KAJ0747138.1 putative F-box domain-containing protein [Helianthus annuus]KAJ0750189.1 putative F-box domain-containing protein [Helianthus annuus]